MDSTIVSRLAELISRSHAIVAFTGAGMSTRSGIPDYRGPQGTWTKRQPTDYHSFMSSEAAREDYWDYKLEWWDGFRHATPNQAHRALVELERADRLLAVITQNVDGLHSLAGTSRSLLIELHGTNALVECQTCGCVTEPEAHFEEFKRTRVAPRCECGGYLKPATISFGQALRAEDIRRAEEAAATCDLMIALGSTLSVYPAASVPLHAAARGVPYVIINSGATDHDGLATLTLRIDGDVTEVLPAAVNQALRVSADDV